MEQRADDVVSCECSDDLFPSFTYVPIKHDLRGNLVLRNLFNVEGFGNRLCKSQVYGDDAFAAC